MTFLFAGSMLLILALVVVISATRAHKNRNDLAVAAKMRSEMRASAKDVWQANVPVKAVIHEAEPIKYDTAVHVDDDISDSQYQVLKALFAETHPDNANTSFIEGLLKIISNWI